MSKLPAQFSSGVFLAIVGTALFALKSIFIKLAYAEGADAILLLALRMLLALPFYFAMLWYLSRKQLIKAPLHSKRILHILGLGFLGYYLASYLNLESLSYISAQLERLTLFTYPAMIAFLSWMFLGEQITKRIIAALLISYVGLFVMYSKEIGFTSVADTRWGMFLCMAAALSFSFYVLFAKPIMQKVGSRAFTSIAMIGSSIFVFAHFFAVTDDIMSIEISNMTWVYAFLLAFVSTVIPSFMMSEAIVRIGAARTTILGSVGPVFTMLLAIVILSEPSSIYHFIGMVVVLVGVGLITHEKPKKD